VEGGAFLDPKFADFAKDVVLFCHVTSKVPDEPHADLARAKGVEGFPGILVLDAEGVVVARHEGPREVAEFGKLVASGRETLDLQKRAAGGDVAASTELLGRLLLFRSIDWREFDRRRSALGTLPPELAARLVVSEARVWMKAAMREPDLPAALAEASKILAHLPDDPEALENAAWCALHGRKDARAALDFALRSLAVSPESCASHLVAADVLQNCGAVALALPHLRAAMEIAPGDAGIRQRREQLDQYGMGSYEATGTTQAGEFEAQKWRATGEANAKAPRGGLLVTFHRDGKFAFSVYELTQPGGDRSELIAAAFDGSHVVRTRKEPWSAEEAEALAMKVASSVPGLMEAARFLRMSLLPPAVEALSSALAADPDSEALKAIQADLASRGWGTFTKEGTVAWENGQELTSYRAGSKPTRPGYAMELAFVVRRDGIVDHAYAYYASPAPSFPDQVWIHGPGYGGVARVLPAPAEPASLVTDLRKAESVLGEFAAWRDQLPRGERNDRAVSFWLEDSVAKLRDALAKDPAFHQARWDLVRAYVAMADRERDAEALDRIYAKGLAAAYKLLETNPNEGLGHLALTIFAFRFEAYPMALDHAARAGEVPGFRGRGAEIVNLLKTTGHEKFEPVAEFASGSCAVREYRRVAAEGSPAPPQGIQVTERCWIATHEGRYRFTLSYRVQRLGDVAERDLVFHRFEQPVVLRSFPSELSPEELNAEVRSILEHAASAEAK
jgi:tetratricopeptide (TPR) repeat protein